MNTVVIVSLHVFVFAFAVCGTLFLIFIGHLFTKSGTKTAYVASVAMKTFAIIMFLTYLILHVLTVKEFYFSGKKAKTQDKTKVEKTITSNAVDVNKTGK